ncbi:hypothetical protein KDN24_19490 [Bacillus sp. Bva_UNVM-123]|uniref:hypothetical protein n=1 Tax=Bacillus sp. Bva_UNVM-123 TaxID=2829798 RepID=UPI00391FB431
MYYYRGMQPVPVVGPDERGFFLFAPFVGGLLGGLLGGGIGAALASRPFYGVPYAYPPPYFPGPGPFGPYSPYGYGFY